MNEMRIMMSYSLANKEDIDKRLKVEVEAGDTKIIWDSDNSDEVAAAKSTFENLLKKKYTAFKVKKDGSSGEKMLEFNPGAEKVILVAPMAGG